MPNFEKPAASNAHRVTSRKEKGFESPGEHRPGSVRSKNKK